MVSGHVLKSWGAALLLLSSAASGCATARGTDQGERVAGSAARIYWVGEEQFKAGEYAQAVGLWRHALLQLPETADADDLRHKLILRIAYGQLVAHHHSGDRAQLQAAHVTLNRYLARHEALFGETPKAKEQREQVYALLVEVEALLDPQPSGEAEGPPTDGVQPDSAPAPDSLSAADTTPGRDAPAPIALEQPPAPRSETPIRDPRAEPTQDPHTGEVLHPQNTRKVTVDTRGLATLDDPDVQFGLRTPWGDPFYGFALGQPQLAMVHGPRPLVRAYALPKIVKDRATTQERSLARRVGFDIIRTARQGLRDCYGEAFTRNPSLVTRGTFEVSVDETGKIHRVRLTDGGVVDGVGDVCAIETLEATRLEGAIADATESLQVRLKLVFFYESGVQVDGNGASGPVGSPVFRTAPNVRPVDRAPVWRGGPYGRPRNPGWRL